MTPKNGRGDMTPNAFQFDCVGRTPLKDKNRAYDTGKHTLVRMSNQRQASAYVIMNYFHSFIYSLYYIISYHIL